MAVGAACARYTDRARFFGSAGYLIRPFVVTRRRDLFEVVDFFKQLKAARAVAVGVFVYQQTGSAFIVAIMTDGMENASKEWTGASVKSLVSQQSTTFGWT